MKLDIIKMKQVRVNVNRVRHEHIAQKLDLRHAVSVRLELFQLMDQYFAFPVLKELTMIKQVSPNANNVQLDIIKI